MLRRPIRSYKKGGDQMKKVGEGSVMTCFPSKMFTGNITIERDDENPDYLILTKDGTTPIGVCTEIYFTVDEILDPVSLKCVYFEEIEHVANLYGYKFAICKEEI